MFRKSYLYYLFFIVIVLTSISSCEKDDVHELDALSNTKFVMKGSMSSLYDIQNNDVKLFNYLSVRAHSHNHTNDLQSKSGGVSSNVVLDTASIQVLEGDNFKNYIFRVLPDSTQLEDVLKNYMLVVLKDSIQQQFMVTYPYVDHKIDTTNVLIEPIFGTDILNQTVLKCGGGSYQSVWIPGGYTDYSCREGRHNVDDGPGSGGSGGCIYYGGWGSASRIFYEGYFTTQYVEQQPCETFDPGSGSNGGGGSGGSYTPPIDDEDEDELSIGVGITPNDGNPVETLNVVGINVQAFFDQLPDELKDYINSTPQNPLRLIINNYFKTEGLTDENKEFVVDFLEIKEMNNDVKFERYKALVEELSINLQ
ncbi:hypothetical protein [Nonlabens sp.]